jgi:hypothetical protein
VKLIDKVHRRTVQGEYAKYADLKKYKLRNLIKIIKLILVQSIELDLYKNVLFFLVIYNIINFYIIKTNKNLKFTKKNNLVCGVLTKFFRRGHNSQIPLGAPLSTWHISALLDNHTLNH